MDKRWRLEEKNRLWVCALVDGTQAGDLEFHFGHAPLDAGLDTQLEWGHCKDCQTVAVLRWLIATMQEAMQIAQDMGARDLYFAVYNDDGNGEHRKNAVFRLLSKMPKALQDWASEHVLVGY